MDDVRQRSNYIRNLRKENKVFHTSHHHFVIPDCGRDGKLLKTRFARVQVIGIRNETAINSILLCQLCQEEKSHSYLTFLLNSQIEENFIKKLCAEY